MASHAGRVVVIGGGITGLAAACELKSMGVEAVVLEAGDRPGGKVDASLVGGVTVDSGPDGFVTRDPAAADLCRRIGLGTELVTPASSNAYLFTGGGLLPMPDRSVLGVPWTADAVAGTGLVSEAGADTLRHGLVHDADPLAGDATVGEVLRPRVGDEVFERLVDPLLGGINAGSADQMSIEACAPPLFEAARRGGPLGTALQQAATRQGIHHGEAASSTPIFQSVRGGITRIVDALAADLGEAVCLSTPAQQVTPTTTAGAAPRWKVTTPRGPVEAGGVIVACPAWESARLVEPLAPDAARILADIQYAGVALAAFVVGIEHLARPLDGSGFLVPRSQGLLMTACSWTSSKWRHYALAGAAVLRVSAGRIDDSRWQGFGSAELAAALADELAETGVISREAAVQANFEAHVTGWPRSLPQFRPGHLERVAALEACLASETPALVAAGAALRGLGLPACIRSGQNAAAVVGECML